MLAKLVGHLAFVGAGLFLAGGGGLLIKSRETRAVIVAAVWIGIGAVLLTVSLR